MKILRALVLGMVLVLLSVGISSTAASAATSARVMVQTQRMSDASLNSGQVGWYTKGSSITLTCFKRGQSVKGYYSPYIPGGWDNLWYKVSDGYFVADVDINTGSNNPVTPECGASPSTGSVQGRNGFAYPVLPHSSMSTYSGHNGDDFKASPGQAVYAMAAGRVVVQSVSVSRSWCPASVPINGAQKEIVLTSVVGGKTYVIRYAHFSDFAVSNGATVKAGQLIGYAGKSGCATGVHVHIDVKVNGALVYPRNLLGVSSY